MVDWESFGRYKRVRYFWERVPYLINQMRIYLTQIHKRNVFRISGMLYGVLVAFHGVIGDSSGMIAEIIGIEVRKIPIILHGCFMRHGLT